MYSTVDVRWVRHVEPKVDNLTVEEPSATQGSTEHTYIQIPANTKKGRESSITQERIRM
jgi:hypothetical protein